MAVSASFGVVGFGRVAVSARALPLRRVAEFGRVVGSARALGYPVSVTWFGRVAVSAHALPLGC